MIVLKTKTIKYYQLYRKDFFQFFLFFILMPNCLENDDLP